MIFLGLLYKTDDEESILAKSRDGLANQVVKFQYNLINGFIDNKIDKLEIVSALPVGIWKKDYSDLVLSSAEWEYRGTKVREIGCVNIPVIKQIQREINTKKHLKKLLAHDDEVLVYSTYLPYLRAVNKLCSSAKVTLVVTDLPEYYDHRKVSVLRKILRKLNNRQVYKCVESVDRFVLLTEAMKGPLKVGERPYTIVEGVCAESKGSDAASAKEAPEKKVIFYAGGLHEKFGIKKLLDAFEMMGDPDAQLWLCGVGDAEEYIKMLAEKDSRIKYFGYVSSSMVSELRAQASVLVNPRPNEGEYTKYSFPSKTMEYLASGIPTVMYKLDGIPDEYDRYLKYIKGDTSEDIKAALEAVLEKPWEERAAMGAAGREYVLNNKNAKYQAKKILGLMQA